MGANVQPRRLVRRRRADQFTFLSSKLSLGKEAVLLIIKFCSEFGPHCHVVVLSSASCVNSNSVGVAAADPAPSWDPTYWHGPSNSARRAARILSDSVGQEQSISDSNRVHVAANQTGTEIA